MLGKNGGVVHGPARIHDARCPGGLQAGQPVGGGKKIAAGQQGNGEAFGQTADGLPLSHAAKSLAGRARVQGDPARARVFKPQGQIGQHGARLVQPQAQFKANAARPRRAQHGPRDGKNIFHIAQHGGSRALAQHLGYGAAHVQVEPAETRLAQLFHSTGKKGGLRAEKLHHQGLVFGQGGQQLVGAGALIHKALGADHFANAHGGPVFPAQQAKRQIAVTGQGRQPGVLGAERQGIGIRRAEGQRLDLGHGCSLVAAGAAAGIVPVSAS